MSVLRLRARLVLAGVGAALAAVGAAAYPAGASADIRSAGTPVAPPAVEAASFVVADAETGAVLAMREPHRRLRPASTLKALTALTLQPRIPAKTLYTATDADERVEGSKAGMVAGGTYTAEQLFLAMFLRSGNDAAHGLAMLNGGVGTTVAQMNAEARRLGAHDTHAVTPDGLDTDGQVSSAYDLALIARAAVANPALVSYATTVHARFPGKVPVRGPRPGFQLWSQQKFVLNYDGALGLKNGYTTLARNTLVTAARRDGHTVIVTLMGTGAGAWKEAAALSDWYFAGGLRAAPLDRLSDQVTAEPAAAPNSLLSQPGSGAGPGAAAARVTEGAGAAGLPGWVRWPLGVLAALAAAVVALRTRVLLRARRRRERYLLGPPGRSSRDATSAKTPSRA